jgi:uncharacterized integral membrane protein
MSQREEVGSEPTTAGGGLVDRIERRHVVAVLVLAAVLWFALENRGKVTVTWWVTEIRSPLILVIIVSAILGVLLDRLVRYRRRRKQDVPQG